MFAVSRLVNYITNVIVLSFYLEDQVEAGGDRNPQVRGGSKGRKEIFKKSNRIGQGGHNQRSKYGSLHTPS